MLHYHDKDFMIVSIGPVNAGGMTFRVFLGNGEEIGYNHESIGAKLKLPEDEILQFDAFLDEEALKEEARIKFFHEYHCTLDGYCSLHKCDDNLVNEILLIMDKKWNIPNRIMLFLLSQRHALPEVVACPSLDVEAAICLHHFSTQGESMGNIS
jgi:hypothetical protein